MNLSEWRDHKWQIGGAVGIAVLILAALLAALIFWQFPAIKDFSSVKVPDGFARSNGRIEAERVDIATKFAGRIKSIEVKEGDSVAAGQLLAIMDTEQLEAQIREARAGVLQAEQQLDQSYALLAQRKSELALADAELHRTQVLVNKGYASRQVLDQRRSAQKAAAAGLDSANSQIRLSQATIEAAAAAVESLKTNLADSRLVAPRAGRIQYKLAQPGEVLGAGGKVLTLLDLEDVYMTIFLPSGEAGRLALGSEARLIFDAAPQYVVPAHVSFVAADAQFTPKYVETKTEREKLMFRVKLQVPVDVLERYAPLVKTGLPGIAYVKTTREAVWPDSLEVSLPK